MGRETKNGGWRLGVGEEKEENGRTGMVWYVCTGDNVHHQLTGQDWTGQVGKTLILMIHDL